MSQKRKLVVIDWVDSHSSDPWRSLDAIEEEIGPLYCRTVGWLVGKKNGMTCVVSSVTDERNKGIRRAGCSEMSIPNKAIIKTRVLRSR